MDACAEGTLPQTDIVLVLSNRKAAKGLVRAAQAAIPTAYLALQPFLKSHPGTTREDYDEAVARRVREAEPDLVVLAGWMHVFGERFLAEMRDVPVINLHPALPGAFDGAHAIDRAWDAFGQGKIEKTGAMVHRVVKEVDRGEPVLVREVAFCLGETKEEFEERLHETEWQLIVEATAKVLNELR